VPSFLLYRSYLSIDCLGGAIAPADPPSHLQHEGYYRIEYIKFEVANFEFLYHTILVRPTEGKFMAVPHYVYLLLKMPGRSRVLTLRGDLKKSYDCDQEPIKYTSTTRMPDSLVEVLMAMQQLS
jgi:hypothetical protein